MLESSGKSCNMPEDDERTVGVGSGMGVFLAAEGYLESVDFRKPLAEIWYKYTYIYTFAFLYRHESSLAFRLAKLSVLGLQYGKQVIGDFAPCSICLEHKVTSHVLDANSLWSVAEVLRGSSGSPKSPRGQCQKVLGGPQEDQSRATWSVYGVQVE